MRHRSLPACLILASASTISAMGQEPPPARPAAPAGATPTITLTDPGAAPRQTLRLAPRPGATGVIDLVMHITSTQLVDGAASPEPPTPGVLMSFATVVTETGGDRIGYTFECVDADLAEDPEVPAAVLDVLRGGITMVEGLRGTGAMSDRGVSLDVTVTRTPGMDANLLAHAQAIEGLLAQVTTPLPAEAVGVGGTWEIAQTVEQDGLAVQEKIICTVAAADGNTVEITMDIRRHAAPQPVRDPNLPAGASAHLTAFAFAGTGRAVLRLDALHAAEAEIDVTNDSTIQLEFSGLRHEVTLHLEIKTKLKAK